MPNDNVIEMFTNEVEATFRELARRAKKEEITYAYVLVQVEEGDHVYWRPLTMGEKSYDSEHLLNEIGHHHVIAQTIFQDIVASMEQEDGE